MRTVQDILSAATNPGVRPSMGGGGEGGGQVGSDNLGGVSGAPPRTKWLRIPIPATGAAPVQIVGVDRYNRDVVLQPAAGPNAIYIGDASVSVRSGWRLVPSLPTDFLLPGGQDMYAVTDAAAPMDLNVAIQPLLSGDRERRLT